MDLRQLIKNYLEKAHFMQVATTKDNQFWICNVYFSFDENLNLL